MGRKNTETILTKEEITKILNEFSTKARIPLSTGVTKMVVGSLILTSITGENQESKFTIKKMIKNPQFIPR